MSKYRHPDSLGNDEATVLWIVVMIVSTIFVWDLQIPIKIISTIIWLKYISDFK